MKGLAEIKWCLAFVLNIFSNENDVLSVDEIDWCLSMVDEFGYYDPKWSRYTIVLCLGLMARKYRACLSKANSVRGIDGIMCKYWHNEADKWASDMKRISFLL